MINSKKLNKLIDDSGIKRKFIAKKVGVSPTSLKNKIEGRYDFTMSEIAILRNLLNLSLVQLDEIFFNSKCELNSHSKTGENHADRD